ncbi:MAG: hypothetical protein ACI379_10500, partial [Nocardioides sp.]|uniref:hypothetical protein n=1 Tax=Nocardioides sp. TaxID=35761 RepID=UPI003F0F0F1E
MSNDQNPAPSETTARLGSTPARATDAGTQDAAALTEAAVTRDKYDQMLSLADAFDRAGNTMRQYARLGSEVLSDDAVTETAPLAPGTYAEFEDEVRAATTGKHGLLTRSVELDADALVVRATVLTYRWIDELQQAAYKTLGSIAGRAIGYLAPEVALGGAIVSAGLIETDALDREGVTAYLNELAESNPELMEHVAGGGGLLDGLQMRSLLTAGILASDQGSHAARGGLRSIGVAPFTADTVSALRDAAGGLFDVLEDEAEAGEESEPASPRTIEDLMQHLSRTEARVSVHKVGEGRYICYLPANRTAPRGRLRLVGADTSGLADRVVAAIERAVADDPAPAPARVMLVGAAQGGTVATEVAATLSSAAFVVDQVVTAGAPSAQVAVIPEATRVLSLEDRADPVALLGSLINAKVANRVTVVFDGSGSQGAEVYLAGGRAADQV